MQHPQETRNPNGIADKDDDEGGGYIPPWVYYVGVSLFLFTILCFVILVLGATT